MPYPVKGLLEVYEDMVEILLMLQVFLAENPVIEYLFCGAPSGSETCLLFCNDLFCFLLKSDKDDLQHDHGSVVLANPVFQILLQTAVRISIMASPPAWTNPRQLTFPSSAL